MPTPRPTWLRSALLALAVPLVALVTVLITLSVSSAPTSGTAERGPAPKHAITIANFSYSPDPLVVKAGTPITITNTDETTHTVTARNGAFDTGDIAGGTRATITISRPGTYRYYCRIHNYMTGTIEVR
jgi:plastocyanin